MGLMLPADFSFSGIFLSNTKINFRFFKDFFSSCLSLVMLGHWFLLGLALLNLIFYFSNHMGSFLFVHHIYLKSSNLFQCVFGMNFLLATSIECVNSLFYFLVGGNGWDSLYFYMFLDKR